MPVCTMLCNLGTSLYINTAPYIILLILPSQKMLPFPLGGNCPVPSRTAGRGSPTGQRHGHPDSTQACRFPAPPASLKLCGFLPDSVVPAEEAPRLRGKRDKLTPGPGSGMDTRPLGLQGGGREKLSLGRSPGGTRGSGQCVPRGVCSATAPSTGVRARCWGRKGCRVPGLPSRAQGWWLRALAVPSEKDGCSQTCVGPWEVVVSEGDPPACLLFGKSQGHLPRPGLPPPPTSRLGIWPSVGRHSQRSSWTFPTMLLLSVTPASSPPPPAGCRPTALPEGMLAPLPAPLQQLPGVPRKTTKVLTRGR